MQITYLSNSGFALEQDDELLIFDCHNPAKQAILQRDNLQAYKLITVFASHAHGDHYSPDIWHIPSAKFVMSFDIPVPPAVQECTSILRPGEQAAVNGMDIHAYGSTDEGICFFVRWGEQIIFHAGDLNDWHWKDEGGEDYARREEAKFLQELARIQVFEKSPYLSFFPVDPRMGSDYYRGAVLFAEAMRPRYLIPMHFGKQYAPPRTFIEEISPYTELLAPPELGQSIRIIL